MPFNCSWEEPAAQEWESSKTPTRPNNRNRREYTRYHNIFSPVLNEGALLLELPAKALCARVIQNYTPVRRNATPLSNASERIDWLGIKHLLDLLERSGVARGWIEDHLSDLLRKVPKHETLERAIAQVYSFFSRLGITQLLADPPPPLFFSACICLTWTISIFRRTNSAHRYQDRILLGGAAVGIFVAAVQSERFWIDVKGYLAWSVVLASFVSVVLQRILSFWAEARTKDSGVEKPVQGRDMDIKYDSN